MPTKGDATPRASIGFVPYTTRRSTTAKALCEVVMNAPCRTHELDIAALPSVSDQQEGGPDLIVFNGEEIGTLVQV